MIGVQKIGRYEILNHLASGGMGQVYLARSTGLGGFERQVVVKTLDLSITDDDDEAFVTMFLDEARLVGALHHQYIAPVYEVGCEDGRYYLVMDYVSGETAEAVYRASTERSVAVPLQFALTVVSCIASALEYAHALCAADGTPLDIVHRDISLSNVMVGYDGAVKLIDFGIAKAANRATKTQAGTLKGKIGYLAPEQILRTHVDHRADIFALGIVLYELTTSTRAFRDASDLVTLERITNGEVRRPSHLVPSYPPELERIVLKALQTDPDKRYQDAGTMGRELERLAARMGLPLGHGAVTGVMKELFGERRSRRRIARGSNDVTTDPTVAALEEDEKTPVTDMAAALGPELRRAQRPTTPIARRADKVAAAGPSGGIAMAREAAPVDRQPLPLAPPRAPQHTPKALDVPTPRVPTGPQLPVILFHDPDVDPADAATTIAPARPERFQAALLEEEEAVRRASVAQLDHRQHPSGPQAIPPLLAPMTPSPLAPLAPHGANAPLARPAPRWPSSMFTHAVASRVKPALSSATRTWLVLCAMFVLAVTAAILLAVL